MRQHATTRRPRVRRILAMAVGLALTVGPAAAQYGDPRWEPTPWQYHAFEPAPTRIATGVPEDTSGPRNPLLLVAGGVAGYAFTRALVYGYGEFLGSLQCQGPCLAGLLAVPLFLAVPTLTPLGVHLANDRQGSFGITWMASTTVGLAALLMSAQYGLSYETAMVVIPASAILAAVGAEWLTSTPPPEAQAP